MANILEDLNVILDNLIAVQRWIIVNSWMQVHNLLE